MKHVIVKIIILIVLAMPVYMPVVVSAQFKDSTNPFSSRFSLAVCDGPKLPPDLQKALPTGKAFEDQFGHEPPYVVCNFRTFMVQVQHLINLMVILGVLAAIVSFTIAGGLYISGSEKNISRARGIFPKVFWGFVIMLTAWFIVYQILDWLTGSQYGSLLGNP